MSESELRFRALVEHGHDVITLLDERAQILFDSRSVIRVMGYTPEERLGHSINEYAHPDDHPAIAAYFERLIASPSVARTLVEARPWFHMYPYRGRLEPRFLGEASTG